MLSKNGSNQKFVIGVDSGGTNYRVKACDLSGNCLGYADVYKRQLLRCQSC